MTAVSRLGFINTVRQTVDGLLPAEYWAEAKYLVDRITAAASVAAIRSLPDIVSVNSPQPLRTLRADPLLRDIAYFNEPPVVSKERVRINNLCRAAQAALTHLLRMRIASERE
jgi:hypothetical protein